MISPQLLMLFGKDLTPQADAAIYPTVEEIRAVLDRVYRQSMDELLDLDEGQLDEKPEKPHPLFDTKLGSLEWAARHEMLHAGQIGLLRRVLGAEPMW